MQLIMDDKEVRTMEQFKQFVDSGYVQSMVVTITLWPAVAPLAAVGRHHWWH
jgi:hypothetical protein